MLKLAVCEAQTNIFSFCLFFSKVVRQAMKDMNSHNYNRFAKVGSSSAYSGFMAREWLLFIILFTYKPPNPHIITSYSISCQNIQRYLANIWQIYNATHYNIYRLNMDFTHTETFVKLADLLSTIELADHNCKLALQFISII